MSKILILAFLLSISVQIQISSSHAEPFTTPYQSQYFPMGALTAEDNLTLNFNLPHPNIGYLSTPYIFDQGVELFDENFNALTPRVIFPQMSGTSDSTSVKVPTAGDYYIILKTGPVILLEILEIQVVVNGILRFSFLDMIRNTLVKAFYFQTQTQQVVKISGLASLEGATLSLTLYQAQSPSIYDMLPSGSPSAIVTNGQCTMRFNFTGLGMFSTPQNPISTPITITYFTDYYAPPFNPQFIDLHKIFDFGPFVSDPSNILSAHQQDVIKGHQCGIRQYYANGTCLNVDSLCNTFNPMTGQCYTCFGNSRPAVNGVCNSSKIICKEGTHLYQNSICIPDACKQALFNGTCTSCVSSAFFIDSKGSCSSKDCGLGRYFSTSLGQCTILPTQCIGVDPLLQNCLACSRGFILNSQGICAPPCPLGQTLVGSNCYWLPSNCIGLNIFLQCTGCSLNMRLSGGQCVPCNGPNPNFPCVTCPLGHQVNSQGECVLQLNCANGQSIRNGICVNDFTVSGSSGIFSHPELRHCMIIQNNVCIQCLRGRSFNSQGQCS